MSETIGIIGGMGNEAMADLAANVAALPDADDYSYVCYGNSRQAFTPEEADGEWEDGDPPIRRKRHTGEFTAALLQNFGAGRVGLACNGGHPLYRDIYGDFASTFVDMIAETAAVPDADDGVLVLGTKRTLEERLYDDELEAAGIDTYQPTPADRQRLMDVIYDPEFGIKTGEVTDEAESMLCDVVSAACDRHPEIDSVVLGCTELPLALNAESVPRLKAAGALPDHLSVIDPTQVLAEALLRSTGSVETPDQVALSAYRGEFLDYDPPLTVAVDSLEQMVEFQTKLVEWTMDYFADRDAHVGGSYMHVPTLFLIDYTRSVPVDTDALDVTVHRYETVPSEPDAAVEAALERNFEAVSHLC